MTRAPRLYDFFLYNDQSPYRELLDLRIALLNEVVDGFVIVCSRETFAGVVNATAFPDDSDVVRANLDKVNLVILDDLRTGGRGTGPVARENEAFSRNSLQRGFAALSPHDLVMISDIDEIPRPEVLARVREDPRVDSMLVLGLDYFNFKFNYKLVHGLQMVWAGPTIIRYNRMTTPQDLRDARWSNLARSNDLVPGAGWHFSFLTRTDDISRKLVSMFSPKEKEWRGFADGARRDRRVPVSDLIRSRQGFHDHMYAGSVWATVSPADYGCAALADLVEGYPEYLVPGPVDSPEEVSRRASLAMWRLYEEELTKVLHHATSRQLCAEFCNRLRIRIGRVVDGLRRTPGG